MWGLDKGRKKKRDAFRNENGIFEIVLFIKFKRVDIKIK